ncbi:MAG: endonuclease [Jatrophihabitans sp.]|nr:MAG: endonuclease [Jatrophihabitans sp.]
MSLGHHTTVGCSPVPALRVMTYNVRSMRDDRGALGRMIGSAEPDVVLVQEAPRFARWRSLCAELARRSGLVVVGGGRPAAANLILTSLRVDVAATHDVRFSTDPGLHHRGAAIAVLRLGDTRFAVAGTHLDLREPPRLRHVDELNEAVARHVPDGVPVIVGGDLNDRPGSRTWQAIEAGRVDVWAAAGQGDGFTSTAADPHQRIDALFADPRWVPRRARVVRHPDEAAASDHLPLVADLDL